MNYILIKKAELRLLQERVAALEGALTGAGREIMHLRGVLAEVARVVTIDALQRECSYEEVDGHGVAGNGTAGVRPNS